MFSYALGGDAELRLLEEAHVRDLFRLTDANRAYLRQWLPWVDDTRSIEDTRCFVRVATQQFASNQGYECGIWWRGELGEAYQGHGLVTRACRALVDHAFGTLHLHRVEIRVAKNNRRSRAIPERLGFREEGLLRDAEWLYDHYVDHVVYGLLSSD